MALIVRAFVKWAAVTATLLAALGVAFAAAGDDRPAPLSPAERQFAAEMCTQLRAGRTPGGMVDLMTQRFGQDADELYARLAEHSCPEFLPE